VLDLDKAMLLEDLCVLSIQESTCDSASPEIDVLLALLGHESGLAIPAKDWTAESGTFASSGG